MRKSRFSEQQIAFALRQAEAGTPVGTVKLMRERMEKRSSSSALRSYAAALAPAISAQIAKACARAVRYAVPVT